MPQQQWHTANGATAPPPDPSSFTLTAHAETDIWRRSEGDDVFSAPIIYQSLRASTFKSVSVTVFAPWKTQYDQGGLVLAFPKAKPEGEDGKGEAGEEEMKGIKWIKAGIEYFANHSVLGVVGTDRFSDWSLVPMSVEFHQKARVRMVREGETLWVYAAQDGADKLQPMREIKWAFMEGRLEGQIWVGVYAAKPKQDEGMSEEESEKGIEVTFTDLEVEVEE